jgi:murein DD-endopeptidase MepM/ murein hydrolase activator NlpD
MENGSLVVVGEIVVQGQEIGRSGNTGHTTMPHLHFAVYRAAADGNTQSIPARFQDIDGIIDRPRRGARYQAL